MANPASIIANIVSGGVGDAFQKIVGSFKTDPTVAAQLQEKLSEAQLELQGKLTDQITAQIDVNKTEASSQSTFVAGWRPAIGWICGAGLFIQFVVNPIATWIAALLKHPIQFPSLDMGTLLTLLGGMLGLGAMRTYEKVQGAPGADKLL